MGSNSTPQIQAFEFKSPGSVTFDASALKHFADHSTVHVLAWVYVNSKGMPDDQKVFSIPNMLTLGTSASNGSGPVLYPEVWDAKGNRFTFEAGEVPTDKWALIEIIWTQSGHLVGLVNGVQVHSVQVSSHPIAPPYSNGHLLGYVGNLWNASHPFAGMIHSVLMTNAADFSATEACAVTPSGAIGNWGSSHCDFHDGAKTTTLSEAPATPFGALSSPPGPTKLRESMPPTPTKARPTLQMAVPSSDSSRYTMLRVEQSWTKLLDLTADPPTGTSQTVSVMTGISLSDSETQTFGMSLGLSEGFDIELLSAKLTATLDFTTSWTQTIEVTTQTETSTECQIVNPRETTTGWWWQGVATVSTFQVIDKKNPKWAMVPADPVGADIYALAFPSGSQDCLRHAKKPSMAATG